MLIDHVDLRVDVETANEIHQHISVCRRCRESIDWWLRTKQHIAAGAFSPIDRVLEIDLGFLADAELRKKADRADPAVERGPGFDLVADSHRDREPVLGMRHASSSGRRLKFASPMANVEVFWRPGAHGRRGMLVGRVIPVDDRDVPERIRVKPGRERELIAVVRDREFVVSDVPAGVGISIEFDFADDGTSWPAIQFDG